MSDMTVDEFEVRESHGVRSASGSDLPSGWAVTKEREGVIVVGVRDVEITLTPAAAIRLAAMLRRLARRVRERNA